MRQKTNPPGELPYALDLYREPLEASSPSHVLLENVQQFKEDVAANLFTKHKSAYLYSTAQKCTLAVPGQRIEAKKGDAAQ